MATGVRVVHRVVVKDHDGYPVVEVSMPDGVLGVVVTSLVAVDHDLRGTVLAEVLDQGDEHWRFSATLELRGDVLAVTVVERTPEVPIAYSTHRIVYRLRA